jgi:hypothetical protein
MEDRIVDWAPYGEHIKLECKNCGATGSTKNIRYIGARTIFVPCNCSVKYLEPVQPADWQERKERLDKQRRFLEEVDEEEAKYPSMLEIKKRLEEEGNYSIETLKQAMSERRERAVEAVKSR